MFLRHNNTYSQYVNENNAFSFIILMHNNTNQYCINNTNAYYVHEKKDFPKRILHYRNLSYTKQE